MFTEQELYDLCFLYDEEIEIINKFLLEHLHEQPNNISPTKFSLCFNETSVATIPTIKCWCGVQKNVSCEERYKNI